jgi:predicted nucleotidyltransferase
MEKTYNYSTPRLFMQGRSKQFYDDFGNRILQIMKNRYSNIQIKKVGSRDRGTHQRDSDLDIRFYFGGVNPLKESIYPEIIALLSDKLSDINGEEINYLLGTSGNVVKARPEEGGGVDLVLVERNEY